MADPTLVNGQITDAVTQSNVKVLGEAPALALGALYQSAAHATGLAMQNAVAAQQQMNILAQAVTAQAASRFQSGGRGDDDPGVEIERRIFRPAPDQTAEADSSDSPVSESTGGK